MYYQFFFTPKLTELTSPESTTQGTCHELVSTVLSKRVPLWLTSLSSARAVISATQLFLGRVSVSLPGLGAPPRREHVQS